MIEANRHCRRAGGAIVYTAIVLFVLVGFVGLAVDWGYMTWTALKLQNAADASALAGAQRVWWGDVPARNAAVEMAALNEAAGKAVALDPNVTNDPAGDVVIGHYDRDTATFTPTIDLEAINSVRVVARRTTGSTDGPLPLIFGPIFDKDSAEVDRYAIAVAEGAPAYADIIALDAHEPAAFHVYGDAYLNVGNGEGSVQVNSDNTTPSVGGSLVQGTKVQFLASDIYVVGTNEERGKPNLPDIHEYDDYQTDPLFRLAEPQVPSTATYPATPKITGVGGDVRVEFHPGYYPEGLEMNAGDNVFLHPGVYILDNGFTLNGLSTLTGYGVMFYLHTGSIHDNGTGDVYLSPPPPGDYYAGIQFFQARDNYEEANFNGDTTWQGTTVDDPATPINESTAGAGTFYFPNAHVEFGGTGNLTFNGLIADTIEIYGTGDVNVTGGYESNKGSQKVYLIE
jgi:hypothetical protein